MGDQASLRLKHLLRAGDRTLQGDSSGSGVAAFGRVESRWRTPWRIG